MEILVLMETLAGVGGLYVGAIVALAVGLMVFDRRGRKRARLEDADRSRRPHAA